MSRRQTSQPAEAPVMMSGLDSAREADEKDDPRVPKEPPSQASKEPREDPEGARRRILIADDHALVLDGFRKLLEPLYDIVGTVKDGRALLKAAANLRPDVVLADISMPLLNGIDAARELRKTVPDAKIIILSMHVDPSYVTEAFRAGASGYLVKRSAVSELVFAIDEVLKGSYYVTPLVARGIVSQAVGNGVGGSTREPPGPTGVLTPRQREVLQLVAEGKSLKEIGDVLNISTKTVEFHKSRLMDELGLRTTAELTRYAVAHGIVSP